ncbi:MAG: cob(I)yrinic acid a,c-diamide adenosyltransferase [Pseudanabaenaceae cyanobacterium SKYGB_i_bin29]|nr:cob(I)yrinic acid a,c-diamide adenosyltransferase [Pseudanabaenaceae cyanobacterium SKYG29]MDW8421281.1 cob(I)yrinic acid a,c-diamide adenosyltransferase [Pseudanabaenaceae cyanobacterium SKYGB_i_bin29]
MVAQVEPQLLSPRSTRKLPRGMVQVFSTSDRCFPADVMVNAWRAAGQGTAVLIVQFLQGGIGQGVGYPRRLLQSLDWVRANLHRRLDLNQPHLTEEEQESILSLWRFTKGCLQGYPYQMLVLDEVCALVELGLVREGELIETIANRAATLDVVITGVNVPSGLLEIADQVTHRRI